MIAVACEPLQAPSSGLDDAKPSRVLLALKLIYKRRVDDKHRGNMSHEAAGPIIHTLVLL